MKIPPNSRQGPQYSWVSSPAQDSSEERFSPWTHRWFPQDAWVKQRPDCVAGKPCLDINIAPSARYGHSAIVYETWNFERDVAPHATLCKLPSISNAGCTRSCLTEDYACTGATSWSNFFSSVSDFTFWKSTLLFGSDDGFSEPVWDAVSESCPSQCCGERRLCARSRDNLGQKVPFDESYMLIFGGQTREKAVVAVDQQEEDLYANCEAYLLSSNASAGQTYYAGCMQFISEELWRYSVKNNQWELLKPVSLELDGTSVPSGRFGHSAVLVTVEAENDLEKTRRQYMYMFGGFSLSCYTAVSATSICSDLWRYEIPWAAQGYWPTPPVVLQGGGSSSSKTTTRWNTGNSWKRMSNAPLSLYRHSMVSTADGSYLIVYGGQVSGSFSSDVLVYTVASDTWTVKDTLGYAGFIRSGFTYQGSNVSYSSTKMRDLNPAFDRLIGPVSGGLVPGARAGHCALQSGEMLVLNGFKTYSSPFPATGSGETTFPYYADSDEIWSFSLEENTWNSAYVGEDIKSPPARKGAACTLLPGGEILLLGGSRADSIYKDVWVFDPKLPVWKRQDHLSFMENVTYHSMVYVASSSEHQIVVFGGKTWTESDLLASDQMVSNDRSCFMNALNLLLATCPAAGDHQFPTVEECALSFAKSDIISKCGSSSSFCCESVPFFDSIPTLESLSSVCTNECQSESFTPQYTSNFLHGIHVFSPARCLNNCSHSNGICAMGACKCRPGWTGDDCSSPLCPGSFCYSDSLTLNNSCVYCSGNGICSNGDCRCDSGYTGPDCSEIACLNNCSSKGFCFQDFPLNQCICSGAQSGDDCSVTLCLNNCTLSGTCNPADGTCACNQNFYGPDCSVYLFAASSQNINLFLVWTLLILILAIL